MKNKTENSFTNRLNPTTIIVLIWLTIVITILLIGCQSGSKRSSFKADTLSRTVNMAERHYRCNEYGPAAKSYIYAILYAEENSPEKVKGLNKKLASVYESWAYEAATKGRKKEDPNGYKLAISLYEKAAEAYPRRKSRYNEYIDRYEKDLKSLARKKKINAVVGDQKKKEGKIDILMNQGKVLMKNQRYSDAIEKFEGVLLINPYHMGASREMRKLFREVGKAGRDRAETQREGRLAENEWKYVNPIEVDEEEESIASRQNMTALEQKLNDITIPVLDFKDTSLSTVFATLEAESKKHNNGNGIKFAFDGVNVADKTKYPPISFSTTKISLGEAINTICGAVGLKAIPIGNQVVVSQK